MFIAALFTTVKTWRQSRCSSTEKWIKKMEYIYTMECYSAIKKNKMMPFAATWMDLGIVIPSEGGHGFEIIYRELIITDFRMDGITTGECKMKTEVQLQNYDNEKCDEKPSSMLYMKTQ